MSRSTAVNLTLFALILVLMGVSGVLVRNYFELVVANKQPPVKYGPIVRFVRNDQTYCSGTVVSDSLIVTAAHCVLTESVLGAMLLPGDIEIRPSNNEAVGAYGRPVYASGQMDQAMVQGNFGKFESKRYITDPEQLTALKVANAKMVSCGYPLGGRKMYCNDVHFDKGLQFMWAVHGVLLPGMSGGPTMLPDGTLIAVNVAVTQDNSVVSPIYNLTDNLKRGK